MPAGWTDDGHMTQFTEDGTIPWLQSAVHTGNTVTTSYLDIVTQI